jgi:hypothetical protein
MLIIQPTGPGTKACETCGVMMRDDSATRMARWLEIYAVHAHNHAAQIRRATGRSA